MPVDYNYKNCQSLFGYAFAVHLRSGGFEDLYDAIGRNYIARMATL